MGPASAAQPRLNAMLIAVFAGAALLLAAVGIYGVIAYSVTQRTREIGLRIALGAPRAAVLGLIVREGMTVGAAGIAAGVAAGLMLGRFLATLVFGVDVRNPRTYAAVVIALGLVALAASVIPARRAASVDPMIALRD
jgi:putative ABC transport system permease protein